jgi:hypothetical protein
MTSVQRPIARGPRTHRSPEALPPSRSWYSLPLQTPLSGRGCSAAPTTAQSWRLRNMRKAERMRDTTPGSDSEPSGLP